jgi:hypothetical protein
MNYPSRNDDPSSKHPTWNQSPPLLAADLTTRQDLNGIANSREHKGEPGLSGQLLQAQSEGCLEEISEPSNIANLPWARRSFGKPKSPLCLVSFPYI